MGSPNGVPVPCTAIRRTEDGWQPALAMEMRRSACWEGP